MGDVFKNFGLAMPMDISSHPDGTPYKYVSLEDKKNFRLWLQKNSIGDFDKLSGSEKESIFKEWKSKQ